VFVLLQLPIVDNRPFLNENSGRLIKPSWPAPIPDEEFVRGFGPIIIRKRGGLSGWVGESEICDAHNSLRFGRIERFLDLDNGQSIRLRIASKRLYSDGVAVCKLEIGIVVSSKDWRASRGRVSLESFLRHIFLLKVRLSLPGNRRVESELGTGGSALARLYMFSTTLHSKRLTESEDWWVRSAQPMLFVDYGPGEHVVLPVGSKIVSEAKRYGVLLASQFGVRFKRLRTSST